MCLLPSENKTIIFYSLPYCPAHLKILKSASHFIMISDAIND